VGDGVSQAAARGAARNHRTGRRRVAHRVVAFVVCVVIASALALAGCRKSEGRLRVAVSFFPLDDLVRGVAGPDADVVTLVPRGKDPHDEASAPNARELARGARAGVLVGLGFDDWIEPLVRAENPKARIVRVGDRVPTLPLSGAEPAGAGGAGRDAESPEDPYVWLDPARARLIVKAIAEELSRADSAHAAGYRARAFELDLALEKLDRETEARLARGGADAGADARADGAGRSAAEGGAGAARNRTGPLVTLTPMLGYFGDRYGVETRALFRAPPGVDPTADALRRELERGRGTTDALILSPRTDPTLAAAGERLFRKAVRLDPYGSADATTYAAVIAEAADAVVDAQTPQEP
jgi:ABC-type Zn uptake system ZnuABC Zn-binding protein ZnuA